MTTDQPEVIADYEARLAQMQAQLDQMQRDAAPREDISEIQRQMAAFEQEFNKPVPGAVMTEPCAHVYPDGRHCGQDRYAHVSEGEGLRARVPDHSYRNLPLKSGGQAPVGFYARQDIPETIPDVPDLDRIKAELLEQLRAEMAPKPRRSRAKGATT